MKRLLMVSILLLMLLMATAAADTLAVSPDGTADYASITEALAVAKDGDVLELAGGVYDDAVETWPIIVDKAVTIRAREGEAVTVACKTIIQMFELRADGIVMRDLDISFRYAGFWVMGDDITIENCHFTLGNKRWRMSSCGAWIAGAKRMTMRGCTFDDCSPALVGPPLSESSAGLPVLTGMFEVGEDIEFFTTHTMEDNLVNGRPLDYVVGLRDTTYTDDCGMLIAVDFENVVIHDVHMESGSIGMQIAWSKNVTLKDSTAHDAGIFGVYVCKSEDCLITDCQADRSAHGFDLRGIERCVLTNCSSDDSGQGLFFSVAFDSIMSHCTSTNAGVGIFAAAGDRNHFDSCTVIGCELGMNVESEKGLTVTNCLIKDSIYTGARMGDVETVYYINNVFDGNHVGAMFNVSRDIVLQGNTFVNTKNCAVYLNKVSGAREIGNVFGEKDAELIQIYDCPERLVWPAGPEGQNAGAAR